MTYAIFAIGSRQFKAEPGLTLKVPKLTAEPGSTVTFDRVLLTSDGKAVQTGAPLVQGAKVTAEVVRHGLGEKIRIFSPDRKSTRLNSSHRCISYAVFCLKKKNT